MPGHFRNRVFICIALVLVNIACGLDISGLSAWTDSRDGLAAGEFHNTDLKNGSVTLEKQAVTAPYWRFSSQLLPWFSSMVYDRKNDVLVGFGGYEPGNQTWIYDMDTCAWTRRFPEPSPPEAKQHPTMFYDNKTEKVLLVSEGEFWSYDTATNYWQNISSSGLWVFPGGDAVMFRDVYSDALVVVGWLYDFWNDSTRLNVFVYSEKENFWDRKRFGDSPSIVNPSSWMEWGIIYDTRSRRTVMLLTTNDTGTDDSITFSYDIANNSWTDLHANKPAPFRRFSLVYDESRGLSVLYGALSPAGSLPVEDTWTFDAAQNTWTRLDSTNTRPALMEGTFDGNRNLSVHCNANSVWTYDLAKNSWRCISQCPGFRQNPSLTFDTAGRRAILFGGGTGSGLNDTWSYDPVRDRWTEESPNPSPPGRWGHAMSYDSARRELLLFGGIPSNQGTVLNCYNDTWLYNLSSDVWTEMNPEDRPTARHESGLVYDTKRGCYLLYGGETSTYDPVRDSVWTYNTSENEWTVAQSSSNPGPRRRHAMAYDEVNDRVFLFGGTKRASDTWLYDPANNTWANVSSVQSPPPGIYSAIYSPNSGRIGLFGDGIVWEYNLSENSWRNITTAIDSPDNFIGSIAYDPIDDEYLVYQDSYARECRLWIYGRDRYRPPGEFTSRPFDTGGSPFFGKFEWDASVPAATSLKFRLRTASTNESLQIAPFVGPDGTTNSFYTIPEMQIAATHNGDRWLQYRVFLNTSDLNRTPVLDCVTIHYNLCHSLKVMAPSEGAYWSDASNVAWTATDPDNDSMQFDIYLENGAGLLLLATDLANDFRNWTWNASTVLPGTYRIRVVARDDNPSIPITVSALSGNFTIRGMNNLPHVMLISPPNNSVLNTTDVTLMWNGTDEDGDPLIYTVLCSGHPLDDGNPTLFQTDNQSLELLGLTDNTTYYWTVIPSDMRSEMMPEPVPVWQFTVSLPRPPPANRPPRIISYPPMEVTAGETYRYNVTATDEDGDPLVFLLAKGPQNASLNTTAGRLSWATTISDVGNHSVTVRVADGKGGLAEQDFTINVKSPPPPPPRAPECRILYPANGTVVKGVITVRGTAQNGTRALSGVRYRLDGGNWTLAVGLENWGRSLDTTRLRNGPHRLEARSFDGELNSSVAWADFVVNNPGPGTSIVKQDWCLPAALLLLFIGLALLPYWWKRSKDADR